MTTMKTGEPRALAPDLPTKLCQVNPRTGELVPSPLADATVLLGGLPPPRDQRRTGDFVPRSGARSTTELTLAWSEPPHASVGLERLRRLIAVLRALPRRTRWLGGAVALGVALWGVLPWGDRPAPAPRLEPLRQAQSPTAPSEALETPTPAGRKAPVVLSQPEPRLAVAIGAVAEGRYAEALQLYEVLHRAHPEDEAVEAALAILRAVDRDAAEVGP